MIDIGDIAIICHEANRRYCQILGDNSQKIWEEAPFWQRQSAIKGVFLVQKTPNSPPGVFHDAWCREKTAEGWVYGEIKDDKAKTHPCLLPYMDLPPEQRVKDLLFKNIVLALTKGDKNV